MIRITEVDRADFIRAEEAGEPMPDVYYSGMRMFVADGIDGRPRKDVLDAVKRFANPKAQLSD